MIEKSKLIDGDEYLISSGDLPVIAVWCKNYDTFLVNNGVMHFDYRFLNKIVPMKLAMQAHELDQAHVREKHWQCVAGKLA